MGEATRGLSALFAQTFTAYARMAATVVIAVVVRICHDCLGIILTGQDPVAVNFWFAHCRGGKCMVVGLFIFLLALGGCSMCAWKVKDWIMDPARNRHASRYSFAVVMDAATWVPISVVVGKTNALIEWF